LLLKLSPNIFHFNHSYFRKMNIRRATIDDIPALNTLVNSAYRGDSSRKGWTTEADLLDGIRTSETSLKEMISRPDAVILIAEENTIEGCVYLEKMEEALYLGMLTVDPELQGKGIGAMLMKAAEERARELHCNKIRLITNAKDLETPAKEHLFPTTQNLGYQNKSWSFW
jgi:N-acetylglutamate synthase-like GNAT family acetyltransferase